MTTLTSWPGQAESWLDARGKGAWIAAMVVGFVVFWPIGLAILAYMIWGKKNMFGKSCRSSKFRSHSLQQSSGNSAFDSYKVDTLKRLEDEQSAFQDFLERLRKAKDQTEFDSFLDERARRRNEEQQALHPAN